MAKLFGKTESDVAAPRRSAATGPLPALPALRQVPSSEEIRQSWETTKPAGPIPAVLNLFGDATGTMLRTRLAAARTFDDYLGIIEEAQAYGDNAMALVALDHASSLAVKRAQFIRLAKLEQALAPSELEQALGIAPQV